MKQGTGSRAGTGSSAGQWTAHGSVQGAERAQGAGQAQGAEHRRHRPKGKASRKASPPHPVVPHEVVHVALEAVQRARRGAQVHAPRLRRQWAGQGKGDLEQPCSRWCNQFNSAGAAAGIPAVLLRQSAAQPGPTCVPLQSAAGTAARYCSRVTPAGSSSRKPCRCSRAAAASRLPATSSRSSLPAAFMLPLLEAVPASATVTCTGASSATAAAAGKPLLPSTGLRSATASCPVPSTTRRARPRATAARVGQDGICTRESTLE